MIFFPVGTLPVNRILETRASSTRRCATPSSQATMLSTPSGRPARFASSPIASPTSVVDGAGFRTTALPAASAAATPVIEIPKG